MDSHETISQLYQREINVYRQQIDDLRQYKRCADEKNIALIEKVTELERLLEKASVANKDLHTAFEHVQEENLRIKHQDQFNLRIEQEGAYNDQALEVIERQYVDLARESVGWITEKDRMAQRNKFLERECERYAQDNKKLGRQIQCLIRTLEEERGMIIRKTPERPSAASGSSVTASDVIDEHLVTFKSIEELQQQNQKLLSLVNYLSNKEEEHQMNAENEDISRLNSDIEALKTQLQSVKDDRERILSAFDTLMKERDLFKILLSKSRDVEHMTPEILQRMVSIACSARPAISASEDTQNKDAHINDLKGMISKLEQDLSTLRGELAASKIRAEEEIKLKTDLLDEAHSKIVKESEISEQLLDRNRVLEDNIKTLMKEFDETRTKMQRLSFELEQAKNENKQLAENLEREKQARQSELHSILSEINSKCELRDELREYQVKLELAQCKIDELRLEIMELARLRTIERNGRVELTRIVHKLTQSKRVDVQVQPKTSKEPIQQTRPPHLPQQPQVPTQQPPQTRLPQPTTQTRPVQPAKIIRLSQPSQQPQSNRFAQPTQLAKPITVQQPQQNQPAATDQPEQTNQPAPTAQPVPEIQTAPAAQSDQPTQKFILKRRKLT